MLRKHWTILKYFSIIIWQIIFSHFCVKSALTLKKDFLQYFGISNGWAQQQFNIYAPLNVVFPIYPWIMKALITGSITKVHCPICRLAWRIKQCCCCWSMLVLYTLSCNDISLWTISFRDEIGSYFVLSSVGL